MMGDNRHSMAARMRQAARTQAARGAGRGIWIGRDGTAPMFYAAPSDPGGPVASARDTPSGSRRSP